jgi:DNA-binding response OmpR family regulator
VDDDRPSREGLSAALTREGHFVDAAGDAWQAMIRTARQSFDIAVVDLDLPAVHGVELGGWDVVRIARAYRPDIASSC